jgi:phosphoenolpyruvate carboxylase
MTTESHSHSLSLSFFLSFFLSIVFVFRPVARDGVTYNIDLIRAIPFTMLLAQMREFTVAYYGTGSAFESGCALLNDGHKISVILLKVRE